MNLSVTVRLMEPFFVVIIVVGQFVGLYRMGVRNDRENQEGEMDEITRGLLEACKGALYILEDVEGVNLHELEILRDAISKAGEPGGGNES